MPKSTKIGHPLLPRYDHIFTVNHHQHNKPDYLILPYFPFTNTLNLWYLLCFPHICYCIYHNHIVVVCRCHHWSPKLHLSVLMCYKQGNMFWDQLQGSNTVLFWCTNILVVIRFFLLVVSWSIFEVLLLVFPLSLFLLGTLFLEINYQLGFILTPHSILFSGTRICRK